MPHRTGYLRTGRTITPEELEIKKILRSEAESIEDLHRFWSLGQNNTWKLGKNKKFDGSWRYWATIVSEIANEMFPEKTYEYTDFYCVFVVDDRTEKLKTILRKKHNVNIISMMV